MDQTLYEATKEDLHACERHPIGQKMVNGTVTREEWADWLWAMKTIHSVVDLPLETHMHRELYLQSDLTVLPRATPSLVAMMYATSLIGKNTGGAAYVLHGAHQSDGLVIAPKMAKRGLPIAHISYLFPDLVQEWVATACFQVDWIVDAKDTFKCILGVMDEIQDRYL